ncbi:PQQ-binding-like beta-propeller repeat protein [Gammaproteobacteria bacterium]|jgi:alcohol dehydrogenase (cytochrome c)|nr:PQQ-binding-like beta-propeller repeat protein [Gammaproteobacteria bacterium]MDA9300905.1 PQQ-binding-like beta-propeller repeat protein [bacterium]MDP4661751.1 PQQ-binding-like beta-propeller repeat protein [OM182 bacterium]MDA9130145.1 PQQ-binding-like beta-propeller repeat protein [Gammaproteobacteria bacterium]MDA9184671.1 PQQ-binding-like beta-propeller repeat protein [Gammaproteobacteria bacterium]
MKMQKSRLRPLPLRNALLSAAVALGVVACGQESTQAPTSTAIPTAMTSAFSDQAALGAGKFAANCAACHGVNLEGTTLGPLLSGRPFLQRWGDRTPSLLFSNIKANMPPGGNEGISDADYLAITAHILDTNGVDAITAALTASTDFTIADNASELVANRQRSEPPAPEGITVAGNVDDYSPFVPVTDAMLEAPDPADWPMIRRSYDAHSFSPLDQINTANVDSLSLEWVWNMHEGDSEPSPLVYKGIIYLINPGNVIQALDGKTGELIWENWAGPANRQDMRNIAIYNDKIIQATTDARLIALDARTGEQVWETAVADNTQGFENSSGPIVADGRVILGLAGCARYIKDDCYISAHDANTGELAWRFNTIAKANEPGGDTWGELDDIFRAGGETWITGSYDPDLKLTYWGTAQQKPWVPVSRHLTINDEGLFTNSTVAINTDDGTLNWHFQHVPAEALDLDEVFERVLVNRGGEKLVFSLGKYGILWKSDRVTGEFKGYKETVFQNAFTDIDAVTGRVTYREDIQNAKLNEWTSACPSSAGGKDWHSMTYHEPSGLMIAPLSQTCLENAAREVALVQGGGGLAASRKFFEMPGTDGNLGKIGAYNVDTMEEVWSHQQRASFHTGTMSTAGDLVFVGDLDRRFKALNARTGKLLWETRLGTSVQGHPVSFAIDGKQYIAVTSAVGGTSPRTVPDVIATEITYPRWGNALYVFSLPGN